MQPRRRRKTPNTRGLCNWLDQAAEQMQSVEPSHDKAYGLITIALAYQRLRASFPEAEGSLIAQSR